MGSEQEISRLSPDALRASWGDDGPPDMILMSENSRRDLLTWPMAPFWKHEVSLAAPPETGTRLCGVDVVVVDGLPPRQMLLVWERDGRRKTRIFAWSDLDWDQARGPIRRWLLEMEGCRRLADGIEKRLCELALNGELPSESQRLLHTWSDLDYIAVGLDLRIESCDAMIRELEERQAEQTVIGSPVTDKPHSDWRIPSQRQDDRRKPSTASGGGEGTIMGDVFRFPGDPANTDHGVAAERQAADLPAASPRDPEPQSYWPDPGAMKASWGDDGVPDRVLLCHRTWDLEIRGYAWWLWHDKDGSIVCPESGCCWPALMGARLVFDETIPPGQVVSEWKRHGVLKRRVYAWSAPDWGSVRGLVRRVLLAREGCRRLRKGAEKRLQVLLAAGARTDDRATETHSLLEIWWAMNEYDEDLGFRLHLVADVLCRANDTRAEAARDP